MPENFKKNREKLMPQIDIWLKSDKPYTVRYALGLLMKLYLGDDFLPKYLEKAAKIKSDEYYINLMIAWFFATALAKQYERSIIYFTENRLDTWVHNKAIQKAVESSRINKDLKQHLKTLKRRV